MTQCLACRSSERRKEWGTALTSAGNVNPSLPGWTGSAISPTINTHLNQLNVIIWLKYMNGYKSDNQINCVNMSYACTLLTSFTCNDCIDLNLFEPRKCFCNILSYHYRRLHGNYNQGHIITVKKILIRYSIDWYFFLYKVF